MILHIPVVIFLNFEFLQAWMHLQQWELLIRGKNEFLTISDYR